MAQKVMHMASLLDTEDNNSVNLTEDGFASEFITTAPSGVQGESDLEIDYVSVDRIVLPEIKDLHGRLSDAIETLEELTFKSVIPLRMANIAPEVTSLQRHEIFTFAGERYAMSHRIREYAIQEYVDRIIACLTTGLPFAEELMTSIEFGGRSYKTLLLSRDEWNLLLSKFSNYKHSLTTDRVSEIWIKISAERIA